MNNAIVGIKTGDVVKYINVSSYGKLHQLGRALHIFFDTQKKVEELVTGDIKSIGYDARVSYLNDCTYTDHYAVLKDRQALSTLYIFDTSTNKWLYSSFGIESNLKIALYGSSCSITPKLYKVPA